MAITLRTLYVTDDGTLYYRWANDIPVAEDDIGLPDWFARSVSAYVAAHFTDLADLADVGVKFEHDVNAAGAEAAIHLANWVQMFAPVDWQVPSLGGVTVECFDV